MKKISASILSAIMMLSMIFSSSVFAANDQTQTSAWDSFLGLFSKATTTETMGVQYAGWVQDVGQTPTDGTFITGPNQLGTPGLSRRLEGVQIKLTGDIPSGASIKYNVHVQNIGWLYDVNDTSTWASDGAYAGTKDRSLRIEDIMIVLVGADGKALPGYSVSYQGHVENEGDTAWVADGKTFNNTGKSQRLECLKVKIIQLKADMTAYNTAVAAVSQADYTKASWTTYQAVVDANKVTEDNSQQQVDAATAAITAAQKNLVTVPVISAVTATAQKQITVTGTELSKLSASMLTVANNTVTKVEANADGTSAVVTLGTDLVPDTNTKVTATIDGTAKDYTVKYSIAATTISIQNTTYDNDLVGQKLVVLVNGVQTDVPYLVSQGYTVTVSAWNSSNVNVTNTFFKTSVNTTGLLADTNTEGTYTAQIIAAKGSTIVTSAKATLKVANLDNNADAISNVQLTNTKGTAFVMNSNTLVVGDTANVSKVTVGYGAAAAELYSGAAEKFTVETSDANVVSVNTSKPNKITATGLGTATLKITVGTATYDVPVTVTGETRVPTTVTGDAFTYIKGITTNAMTVVVKDQYGDPLPSVTTIKFTNPGITGLTSTPAVNASGIGSLPTTNSEGKATIAYAGATVVGESGNVVFRNDKNAVIGSVVMTVSGDNNATTRKLVYDTTSKSKDDTIDTDYTSKSSITYGVGLFNANGVQIGSNIASLKDFTVKYNGDIVGIVEGNATALPGTPDYTGSRKITGTVSAFTLVPKGNGTTTLVVTDANDQAVETKTITVVNGEIKISSVAFKSISAVANTGTITYKDVFNYSQSSNDDLINDVTLSTASVYKVRILENASGSVPAGTLYLDKDISETYTAGDAILGTVTLSRTVTAGAWDSIGNAISGQNLRTGNKGTLTFTVTDTVTSPSVVKGTKTLDVNIGDLTPGAVVTFTGGATSATPGTAITASTTEAGNSNWTTSNPAVATIVPSSGVMTLLTPGTVTVGYTSSTSGKVNYATFTVVPVGITLGSTTVKTAGAVDVLQKAEIQVTHGATGAGNITIDGETVAVLATDDLASEVAAKIVAHSFTNWTVALKDGTTDTVVYTAKVAAANTVIDFADTDATGVTLGAQSNIQNGAVKAKGVSTTTVTSSVAPVGGKILLNVTVGSAAPTAVTVTLAATDDTTAEVATAIAAAIDTALTGTYDAAANASAVEITQTTEAVGDLPVITRVY